MAKLSSLRSDLSKEKDGVWVEFGEGVAFKIARTRSPEFKNAIERMVKQYRRTHPRATTEDMFANDEAAREQIAPHMAESLLLDWRNIDDDDGKAIPYSTGEAKKILVDPELFDVFAFVLEQAGRSELYRREDVEKDSGNFESTSAGK